MKGGAIMSKDLTNSTKETKKAKVSFFKRIARFFKDLKSEFKKIVWPTKKSVLHNTGVVVVFMGVVAVGIWLFDLLFIYLGSLVF